MSRDFRKPGITSELYLNASNAIATTMYVVFSYVSLFLMFVLLYPFIPIPLYPLIPLCL
jgi:hypothetical protein